MARVTAAVHHRRIILTCWLAGSGGELAFLLLVFFLSFLHLQGPQASPNADSLMSEPEVDNLGLCVGFACFLPNSFPRT